MSTLRLDLDDALVARLSERATRAGVAPEALAQAALASYLAEEDPLAFVGIGEAAELTGRGVDELLSEGYAGAQ